jgi:site-specific recombinase XerD
MVNDARKVQKYRPRVEHHRVRRGGDFARWLTDQGYSARTVDLYTRTVRRAARFLDEHQTTIARAGEDDLRAFWETVPATRSSRALVRYALIAYYRFSGRPDGRPDHAHVTGVTPHRWRHTVATLALERTRDLRGVQEWLGHASVQSTQLYTGVTANRLAEIVSVLPE